MRSLRRQFKSNQNPTQKFESNQVPTTKLKSKQVPKMKIKKPSSPWDVLVQIRRCAWAGGGRAGGGRRPVAQGSSRSSGQGWWRHEVAASAVAGSDRRCGDDGSRPSLGLALEVKGGPSLGLWPCLRWPWRRWPRPGLAMKVVVLAMGRGAPASRWRRRIHASRRRWSIQVLRRRGRSRCRWGGSGVWRWAASRQRQLCRREASERRERRVRETDLGGNEAAGLIPLRATRMRGSFLGWVQPCRVGKLESSFSLGQGRGAFFGWTGHCPLRRAGLTNTEIYKYLGWDGNSWADPGYQKRPLFMTLLFQPTMVQEKIWVAQEDEETEGGIFSFEGEDVGDLLWRGQAGWVHVGRESFFISYGASVLPTYISRDQKGNWYFDNIDRNVPKFDSGTIHSKKSFSFLSRVWNLMLKLDSMVHASCIKVFYFF
jgi:hypothetical protein